MTILGVHHITAIASDPQANIDFYAGVLGLRLVKLTVNFDDPGTYHLYYGDGRGTPGTIITFFPWPSAPHGRKGTGQVTASAFAIPPNSIDYWVDRLGAAGVNFVRESSRFGDSFISLSDPDGMTIDLIESERADSHRVFNSGEIPSASAIRGIHSATLAEEGYQSTATLLIETMGFRLIGQEENRFRYAIAEGQPGSIVDVVCTPEQRRGSILVGTVHHIAWRTADDDQQKAWLDRLVQLRYNVSPVMDRKYFHSIYFREPGGVLFEIATDQPGFAVDEPADHLGESLVLPLWLEPQRARLEAGLPALKLPKAPGLGS